MARQLVLDQFIPYRLSVASNAVSSRISESYRRRFGLKIAEWRIVAILAEHPRMTPQALGDATRMDKISVSRAASALLERSLINAENNPEDGRSHLLSLTSHGRSLYDEIAPKALAMEEKLLSSLAPDERSILIALLTRLENAAGEGLDDEANAMSVT